MLFNSHIFIFIFLPIAFFLYFYLNKIRLVRVSKLWMVFASLFFYSWWNIYYLPLILASISINYFVARKMIEHKNSQFEWLSKTLLLKIGLAFNIGLLVYFKYMDFFITNTNELIGSQLGLLHLALPLAISFFTLQQIAFLVDSSEGLVKKINLLDYSIFVTFFPQLIAGPIVHHKEMMPQFADAKNKLINYENVSKGLFIFSIGLFKKVVIADTFAVWATTGFDSAESLNLFAAWATSLSYTFQLYFDFSGYTDMAIGLALLFNIRLPINFNSPYKATGMIDFWKRWHITLTNFITTYIYTPILRSFNVLTFNKAMIATLITFLISGLWHGASWMFVIFGGLNGLGIIINHYWKKKAKLKLNKYLGWFITFNYVNITFVFFRAREVDDALKVLSSMFSLSNVVLPSFLASRIEIANVKFGGLVTSIHGDGYTPIWLVLGFVFVLGLKNSIERLELFRPNVAHSIFFVFILGYTLLSMNNISEFLYFQF